jgi:hypothetical protein
MCSCLVDRVRLMVFPTIRGATGAGPVFAEAPDLDLRLITTRVIDDRLVLLDYRVSGAVEPAGGNPRS